MPIRFYACRVSIKLISTLISFATWLIPTVEEQSTIIIDVDDIGVIVTVNKCVITIDVVLNDALAR